MTSNLRPRTEYELRVRADNLDINGLKLSPLAVIDVSTALPEGKERVASYLGCETELCTSVI